MLEACAAVTEPAKPSQHSREAAPRSFYLFLKEGVHHPAFQVLCHPFLKCKWQGMHVKAGKDTAGLSAGSMPQGLLVFHSLTCPILDSCVTESSIHHTASTARFRSIARVCKGSNS